MLADKRKLIVSNPTPFTSPLRNPQILKTERQGDFQKSLCRWAANMSRNILRIDCCPHRILRLWVPPASRKRRRGFRRGRIPPRRAHDTLQPQAESIIVGYYTSALRPQACFGVQPPQAALSTEMKCLPGAYRVYTNYENGGNCLWQEAMVFTVPAQETQG